MLLVVMGGDTDGDTGHCFWRLLSCAGDCTRPTVSGVHSQRPSWGQRLLGQGVHSSSRAVAERRQAGPPWCPHTFHSKAPSSPRPGPLRTSCMCCGARTSCGGRQRGVSSWVAGLCMSQSPSALKNSLRASNVSRGVQAPLRGPHLGHVLVEDVISTGPEIRHLRTGTSSAVLGMALRCWLLACARGATLEKSPNYGESRSTLRPPSRDQGWS